MSTKGSPGEAGVNWFREEWEAGRRHYGVRAPLPSNWQDHFYQLKMPTRELADLIPIAMSRPGIDNRWRYFIGVARNHRAKRKSLYPYQWPATNAERHRAGDEKVQQR